MLRAEEASRTITVSRLAEHERSPPSRCRDRRGRGACEVRRASSPSHLGFLGEGLLTSEFGAAGVPTIGKETDERVYVVFYREEGIKSASSLPSPCGKSRQKQIVMKT